MIWSLYSPDLNTIENLWSLMKREIYRTTLYPKLRTHQIQPRPTGVLFLSCCCYGGLVNDTSGSTYRPPGTSWSSILKAASKQRLKKANLIYGSGGTWKGFNTFCHPTLLNATMQQ